MSEFELTREAKEDLRAIAKFTEKRWGRKQRFLYIKQFDEAFHLLASSSSFGKSCDHIKQGYRKFSQGSHIIFYKETSNSAVLIVRILHKSMDIESKF